MATDLNDPTIIDLAELTAEVAGPVLVPGDERYAGPGVEMQNLVDTAAREGLAPIAGSSPNIGVVGFTLGGGLSTVLGRTYGYAADHVQSAEIVTPDGELRHTDAQTSPDLFWVGHAITPLP
jgi:FAD/FMN-containing dehydrogenase